jgi:hypothetical protein
MPMGAIYGYLLSPKHSHFSKNTLRLKYFKNSHLVLKNYTLRKDVVSGIWLKRQLLISFIACWSFWKAVFVLEQ